MPIDFARVLRERVEAMTPEERVAYEARKAALESLERATRPIASEWSHLTYSPAPSSGGLAALGRQQSRPVLRPGERPVRVASTETRMIGIRVESDGRGGEILRFVGGPTGYEAYGLDQDFCARLLADRESGDDPEAGVYAICFGTPDRWRRCTVAVADIVSFLDEARPAPMAAARAAVGSAPAPRG
jgi:hypothetical protein